MKNIRRIVVGTGPASLIHYSITCPHYWHTSVSMDDAYQRISQEVDFTLPYEVTIRYHGETLQFTDDGGWALVKLKGWV